MMAGWIPVIVLAAVLVPVLAATYPTRERWHRYIGADYPPGWPMRQVKQAALDDAIAGRDPYRLTPQKGHDR